MEILTETIVFIAILLCLIYTVLIAMYCFGWMKSTYIETEEPKDDIFVSILVSARNEEENIQHVLMALESQVYPKNNYEVIVIDDCSTDDTVNKVKEMYSDSFNNLSLIINAQEGNIAGKKSGITEGIKLAKGKLIITVDADCIMFPEWLSVMVAFYKSSNAKMIVAPVCFYESKSFFQNIQSLEFMALIASTGGSLYFNKAIMCNGANLAYSKKIFEEVNGFEGINNSATGDDVLLMYKIKNKYPHGVKFIKNWDTIAFTFPKQTIKEFVNQRKRWASKRFSDLNPETKFVSLIVYFFNLFLLLLPVIACFQNPIVFYPFSIIIIWLLLFAIKCIIDFLLLFLSASFFKEKKLLIYFLPEQIIYVFYVVLVGFLGLSKKYEWKGRTINEK